SELSDDSILTIINPSKEPSPCIINVYGEGDGIMKINEEEILLYDIQEQIIINGIKKIAYKDNMNLNNNMEGLFSVLTEGKNNISIEGNIDKIEVQKRWCWR